jgi:hypothetical protein
MGLGEPGSFSVCQHYALLTQPMPILSGPHQQAVTCANLQVTGQVGGARRAGDKSQVPKRMKPWLPWSPGTKKRASQRRVCCLLGTIRQSVIKLCEYCVNVQNGMPLMIQGLNVPDVDTSPVTDFH